MTLTCRHSLCTNASSLLVATREPPALHTIHPALFSQELAQLEDEELADLEHVAYFSDLPWLIDPTSESRPDTHHFTCTDAHP